MGFGDSTRKRKRCEHAGCTKKTNFNLEGEKRGRFCTEHKPPDIVVSKRCEHAGCTSLNPVFNLEGETRGRFFSHYATKLEITVEIAGSI